MDLLGFPGERGFKTLLTKNNMMNPIIVINKDELADLITEATSKSQQQGKTDKKENPFLDVNQAASFLNLAKQTLYGMTSRRSIPFFKKGKKLYFRQADLENWLMSGRKMTMEEIKKNGLDKDHLKGGAL